MCAHYALPNWLATRLARSSPSGERPASRSAASFRRGRLAVLSAYLERLGVELHGDAYIFRNRSGAPYSSDTLGDDFRDVRAIEFGALERRTIGHDFRRTSAGEAIAGGANAEQLAHAMGNTLSASNALFATYVPVNVATLRDVMSARRAGRRKLR